jgi:murein DD-endopeptidase MepM/ murein hydrolase activator NlpD
MKSTSISPLIKWVLLPGLVIVLVAVGYFLVRVYKTSPLRTKRVISWIRNPSKHPEWSNRPLVRCLHSTPFSFPTEGFIGFLWGDSFRPGHHHQGIDIFTSKSSGETPVYAAYSGYLTRHTDWKSSLIIRIPQDPLNPDNQIWTYYTHMADMEGNSYILDDFPPGTSEFFVEEGTLLGYQGNYSGTPGNPVGIHLHFSIVKDDGKGSFLNELKIQNTLDPSPYFDLPLNGQTNQDVIPICQEGIPNP